MFSLIASTNNGGTPYLRTNGVKVGTDSVDFSLGFRRIPLVGYITVNLADAIPTGTTGTLPVRITLNGNSRNITFFGGSNVTVADVTSTGVITLFYDYFSGLLQLVSPLAPTA